MACQNLDATILLEDVPEVTFADGLFYVTDRIGSLTIRRCLRPSTFLKLVRRGQEAARQFAASDMGNITQMAPARH